MSDFPRANGERLDAKLTRLSDLANNLAAELTTALGDRHYPARTGSPLRVVATASSSTASFPVDRVRLARLLLKARRKRESLLPAELFADPAWDMLLDLFACAGEGVPVSISTACIAGNVPSTTGLRWLAKLEEVGLVRRCSDPSDARRSFVELTVSGREAVDSWLCDTAAKLKEYAA